MLGLTIAPAPQAATRRPITETDLFSFVWIADPQMAPDGSRVAFVRVAVNRQKEQYETSIWIAGTSAGAAAPQPFTTGPRDSSPALVARRHAPGVRPRRRSRGPRPAAADLRHGA